MYRITQYIISFSLFLLNSNIVGSQERSSPENPDETFPTTAHSSANTRHSHILSPMPRKFIISANPNLDFENHIRKQESIQQKKEKELELRKASEDEQRFRSYAHWQMASQKLYTIFHTEVPIIRSFRRTNVKIHYQNGYYEMIDFYDIYFRKLPSERFASLVLPLWESKPFAFRDSDGYMQVQWLPRFLGYTYKRDDHQYWHWVDSASTN
jgi:hypothetical protein